MVLALCAVDKITSFFSSQEDVASLTPKTLLVLTQIHFYELGLRKGSKISVLLLPAAVKGGVFAFCYLAKHVC